MKRVCLVATCLTLCACAGTAQVGENAREWIEPSTGMVFARIPAGTFVMGSPDGEPGRDAQERRHTVTVARPFWLGAFEVTQAEWERVMGGDNPGWFHDDRQKLPIENITWFEVHEFLSRLNSRSPGSRFRLPTEPEWEYACRAGTTAAYATGPTLDRRQANVADTPGRVAGEKGRTTSVGSFAPNAWGLHDMHGNVWEWTEDEYCPYTGDGTADAPASCGSPLKVIRGGSWYFGADSARCALRYTHRPQDRGFSLGFRVVRE